MVFHTKHKDNIVVLYPLIAMVVISTAIFVQGHDAIFANYEQ